MSMSNEVCVRMLCRTPAINAGHQEITNAVNRIVSFVFAQPDSTVFSLGCFDLPVVTHLRARSKRDCHTQWYCGGSEQRCTFANVNISVISTARGFQRSVVTNSAGQFVVPLLPPGVYIVKAEQSGFAPAEIRDLLLNVNDQVAVEIQMKVGALTENIEVLDSSSLSSDSPAVSTVVSRNFVENMPLNGRSFQSLIALTPGAVITGTNVTDQGQFSVNGQRANANYYTVDGVSANFGSSASLFPGDRKST